MGYLIATIGLFVFIFCIVWFFVRLIKRKPKKQPVLGMLICFILIIAGVVMTPSSGDSKDNHPDKAQNEKSQSVEDAGKDELPVVDDAPEPPSDLEPIDEKEKARAEFDKSLTSGGTTFYKDVRNDVTGRWRVLVYYSGENIVDHAVDYYNTYFESDNEVHIVVNLGLKTTSVINVFGGSMQIDVHEYVDKEEHDAKALGSGMLLKSYTVNLSSGETEELDS